MAVNCDLVCSKCGHEVYDRWSSEEGTPHVTSLADGESCDGRFERLWSVTKGNDPMCHPADRCVVYISEKEGGRVQYPGKNDVPVPPRLAARGYQKIEMSPRQLMQFERRQGVCNERLNFNNGNGMHN